MKGMNVGNNILGSVIEYEMETELCVSVFCFSGLYRFFCLYTINIIFTPPPSYFFVLSADREEPPMMSIYLLCYRPEQIMWTLNKVSEDFFTTLLLSCVCGRS